MHKVLITGNSEYRVNDPYRNLKIDGIEFTLCGNVIKNPFDYDAVFLHQPITPAFVDMIKDLREEKKIVVVDCDDNATDVPPWNESFDQMKDSRVRNTYLECIRLCNYLHVSTPGLKEVFRQQEKTTIFYNGIDFNKYNFDAEKIRSDFRSQQKIPSHHKIVMWAGSPTHADSIMLILPVITKLMSRGDATVVMCSNEWWLKSFFPDGLHENIRILSWVPFDVHVKMPCIADVFLAPLPKNKFNQCKSELKILESGVFGVPCVASDVAPYRRFYDQQKGYVNVLLVRKERVNLWLSAIDSALYEVCVDVGKNAMQTIKDSYNLETINKKRSEWWKKILKKKEAE